MVESDVLAGEQAGRCIAAADRVTCVLDAYVSIRHLRHGSHLDFARDPLPRAILAWFVLTI